MQQSFFPVFFGYAGIFKTSASLAHHSVKILINDAFAQKAIFFYALQ